MEERDGSLPQADKRDEDPQVADTVADGEALLDHHNEEMLLAFSDPPRMHENDSADNGHSIQ